MEITKVKKQDIEIAVVTGEEAVITDLQSGLDFMATVNYETGCDCIVIMKSLIGEEFFDLKTKIAGEILQKFANYRIKVAIVGDFSKYTSKSLKDFIYECNNGQSVFFLGSEEEAIEKL